MDVSDKVRDEESLCRVTSNTSTKQRKATAPDFTGVLSKLSFQFVELSRVPHR